MGRRLYVGNLPYTTGETELQELFSRAGTVESVRVMRDAATGRARGFAFVEMATDEEAQKAASEFNQYQMGGRALTVNEARPKPEGGFGGGGGYGGNRGGGGGRREPRWSDPGYEYDVSLRLESPAGAPNHFTVFGRMTDIGPRRTRVRVAHPSGSCTSTSAGKR